MLYKPTDQLIPVHNYPVTKSLHKPNDADMYSTYIQYYRMIPNQVTKVPVTSINTFFFFFFVLPVILINPGVNVLVQQLC